MSDSGEVRPSSMSTSAEAKAEMRQWVDRWKVVGPILDAERWGRLLATSDDELRRQSADLLSLWRPEVGGDDGEAILLQQRTFALDLLLLAFSLRRADARAFAIANRVLLIRATNKVAVDVGLAGSPFEVEAL